MYACQLLGFLLLALQVILNGSSTIAEISDTELVSAGHETPTPTRAATLPEGYVTFSEDHAAYKIHEELVTWFEARDRCISEGGRLAITDTREKVAHINSLKKPSGQWIHVGIHRSNTSDEWVRVDNGLAVTSMPWATNNPDGTGSCAGVAFLENGLVDYPCHGSGEYFVCEITI